METFVVVKNCKAAGKFRSAGEFFEADRDAVAAQLKAKLIADAEDQKQEYMDSLEAKIEAAEAKIEKLEREIDIAEKELAKQLKKPGKSKDPQSKPAGGGKSSKKPLGGGAKK